jgi:hypothetical protein
MFSPGVVKGSKQYPDHIECHTQVVKDLKERDEHDKIQVREVVLVRLTMDSHVHSRLLGKERRWTYNGSEIP